MLDTKYNSKLDRFIDFNEEPLTMMTPIQGFAQVQEVSLDVAVSSLALYVPEVENMVYVVKEKLREKPEGLLTVDQAAAIMLYTLEWSTRQTSLYYILNVKLRTENRAELHPWFPYLKLFVTGLARLPAVSSAVYRVTNGCDLSKYPKGNDIKWWGFSSCSQTMDILNNKTFRDDAGKTIMFHIECLTGRDISQYSFYPSEQEVLLPAARQLKVMSIVKTQGGLTMIQLREIIPSHDLLELLPSPKQNQVVPVLHYSNSIQRERVLIPVINSQPDQSITSKALLILQSYFFQNDSSLIFH